MRIVRVAVEEWRNLKDVEVDVPAQASLVCVVGENGTGKSHLLELLAAAAERLGLSPGVELSRGNPFAEIHDIEVDGIVGENIPEFLGDAFASHPQAKEWDGRIRVSSSRDAETGAASQRVYLPQFDDGAPALTNAVVTAYQRRQEISHVYVDADRAYPPQAVAAHEWANAVEQPYGTVDWERQWSYRPTRTLFGEWLKYMLAVEQQASTALTKSIRSARSNSAPEPSFVDPFDGYAKSISEVLPHLQFTGVDSSKREITYDTAGVQLNFSRLSGGEKEIAFLVGQIERFGLRRGLLLIDEPELHLNPDLLRVWLHFLSQTITSGQIWIATHSLEAVEVAGAEATLVAEREPGTRVVRSVRPVADQPLLLALSRAVGSPAFSLHDLEFILVEGDGSARERTRFHELCRKPSARFLESGSCGEVLRRLRMIRELSTDIGYPLNVRAVIDRDFRDDREVGELEATVGVHVLQCHEIENVFLHPDVLMAIGERNGLEVDAIGLLRSASDRFAGLWILQRGSSASGIALTTEMRRAGAGLDWATISRDIENFAANVATGASDHDGAVAVAAFRSAAAEYTTIRDAPALWELCLGKQVLSAVPTHLGLAGPTFLEQAASRLWNASDVTRPEPLRHLLEFVTAT